MYRKNAISMDRLELPDYQDVYKSRIAWRNEPYLAVRPDGTAVGYLTATRLLFGPLPSLAIAPIPPAVQAWLPLPLSWNLQDRV